MKECDLLGCNAVKFEDIPKFLNNLAYFSSLNMEVIRPTETSVPPRTSRRYNPKCCTLNCKHSNSCK
jgi:hypothetical protein